MNHFKFSVKKTDTLRNQIYYDIKYAILHGKLPAGTRLRENDLAIEMGVSRGPIREAILLLAKEGLVASEPHKETVVCKVEEEEVRLLLNPLRLLLESFSIQKILANLREENLDRLEQIYVGLMDACANSRLEQIVEQDLQFHEYLVSLTNEPHLISLWQSVAPRIALYFVSQLKKHQEEQFANLVTEHRLLLDAIRTREWSKVEPLLAEHIY